MFPCSLSFTFECYHYAIYHSFSLKYITQSSGSIHALSLVTKTNFDSPLSLRLSNSCVHLFLSCLPMLFQSEIRPCILVVWIEWSEHKSVSDRRSTLSFSLSCMPSLAVFSIYSGMAGLFHPLSLSSFSFDPIHSIRSTPSSYLLTCSLPGFALPMSDG